jgi:hypothetical protein
VDEESPQLGGPDQASTTLRVVRGRRAEHLVDEAEQSVLSVPGEALLQTSPGATVGHALLAYVGDQGVPEPADLVVEGVRVTVDRHSLHDTRRGEQVEVSHRLTTMSARPLHVTRSPR